MKKYNKKTINLIIRKIFVAVIILVSIVIVQISLSKYVKQIKDEHAQESTQFYFESDIATTENKEYQIRNWNGKDTQEINFIVRNYTNNLLKSEEDITYNININITDENNNQIENGTLINTYIKNKNSETENETLSCLEYNSNEHILVIEPVDGVSFTDGQILKIGLSINSIAPYTKEISSNIILEVKNDENYEISMQEAENQEYVTLNLKINQITNDINIKYDTTKLILDKSYYLVNDLTETSEDTKNSFIIPQAKQNIGESYKITFIKMQSDTQIILGEDIIVE